MGSEDVYKEFSKQIDLFLLTNVSKTAPLVATHELPVATTLTMNPHTAKAFPEYSSLVYTIKLHERNWVPQGGLKKGTPIGAVLRVMACQNMPMEIPKSTDSPSQFPYLACSYLEKAIRTGGAINEQQYIVDIMFRDQMRAFRETFFKLQRDLELQMMQYLAGNVNPPPVTFKLPNELVLGEVRSKYPIIAIVPHGKMLGHFKDADTDRKARDELSAILSWQETPAFLAFEAARAHAFKLVLGISSWPDIKRHPFPQGGANAVTFLMVLKHSQWDSRHLISKPKPDQQRSLNMDSGTIGDISATGTCESRTRRPLEALLPPFSLKDPSSYKSRFDWIISAPLSSLNYPFASPKGLSPQSPSGQGRRGIRMRKGDMN